MKAVHICSDDASRDASRPSLNAMLKTQSSSHCLIVFCGTCLDLQFDAVSSLQKWVIPKSLGGMKTGKTQSLAHYAHFRLQLGFLQGL